MFRFLQKCGRIRTKDAGSDPAEHRHAHADDGTGTGNKPLREFPVGRISILLQHFNQFSSHVFHDKIAVMKRTVKFNLIHAAAILLSAAIVLSMALLPVRALDPESLPIDDAWHVVDFASDAQLDSYDSFAGARKAYQDARDSYDNLGIVYKQKVVLAEYGIGLIRSTDACDVNITYTDAVDGLSGYTNGCYGIDAAYLDTSSDGTQAEFLLGGVTGWASLDDITIVPMQNISFRLTSFTVTGGRLYHQIKTEITDDFYASIQDLGAAPSYLSEGTSYISYDGHYFYPEDSLWKMLDDIRSGSHDQSANPSDPYYDYYQFVSHRTQTAATEQAMEDYLRNTMGIIGLPVSYQDDDKDSADDTLTRSQYYGLIPAFWQYQYEYGANALMMFALSENESSNGTSALSYTRNNLFGHAAYDSDVEANASRYLNVVNSVYSHAKYYISGSYSSPLKSMFHGSFFGNKSAGMNVAYASDPYWGEKAAAYYRKLDEGLGSVDLNRYTIGIKTSDSNVDVYQFPQNNADKFYNTGENPDFGFVILSAFSNEDGDWYKVQSEATLDENSKVDLNYYYDYSNDVGYIHQSDVQVILNGKQTEEPSYVHVTLDAAGGTFPGSESTITYALQKGAEASAVVPVKSGALFTGWSGDLSAVNEDTTFTAQYRDVSSISMENMPQQAYELNDRINLKNGTILVNFADGSTASVPLNTSMVSGFDLSTGGEQTVTVSYAGSTATYAITVNGDADTIRADLKQQVQLMIAQYADKKNFSEDDKNAIIALKQKIDDNMQPYLTQKELRSFDTILRKAISNRIRYVLEKNPYDLGVSGLSVSYPLNDSLSKFWLIEDTYRIRIGSKISDDALKAMTEIANYMEDQIDESFNVVIRKNYDEPDPEGPLLLTINKPEGADPTDVYTVLHYQKDTGDVVQCYTRQTDGRITFMTRGEGTYMVVSRRTSNAYTGTDPVESVTSQSSSKDVEKIIAYCSAALAAVFLFLLLLHRFRRKHKEKKVHHERIIKEEKRSREPAPPVDMTQALQNLETTMLDLKVDEIQKEAAAEDEAEKDRKGKK